ncbi:MAG: hypothetical protein HY537_09625 [Deltaproteobacteria bacterium]|nr:hypothetical protein [Deltaproteobacteria bacterium]
MKYALPAWFINCLFCLTVMGSVPPTGAYQKVVTQMQALQQLYPQRVALFSMGENDEGVEILAMRISTTPQASDPAKVANVIVSTHHGNEQKATAFTMKFVEDLIRRYSSNELWRGQLAQTEWAVIPVLNVSGYNANNRYEHGVDPNRDYPGPCTSNPGGALKSIRLLMSLLNSRVFSGSITVHGYIGTLTYPWGMNVENTHCLDHNQFEQMTSKAARLNGYRYGTSTDVVYAAEGTYEDYAFLKHGLWSLLLELRSGSDSDIAATVQAIALYFDQLDSSPSTHNQLNTQCARHKKPDLHLE